MNYSLDAIRKRKRAKLGVLTNHRDVEPRHRRTLTR